MEAAFVTTSSMIRLRIHDLPAMFAELGMWEKLGCFLFWVASITCVIWAAFYSSQTKHPVPARCGARRRQRRRNAQAFREATVAVENQSPAIKNRGPVNNDFTIFWKWNRLYTDRLQAVLATVVAQASALHINKVDVRHASVVAEIVAAARSATSWLRPRRDLLLGARPHPTRFERETSDLSNVKEKDIELGHSSDSAEPMPTQARNPPPDSGPQEIAQLDPAKVILEETMIPDDTSTRAPVEEENAPLGSPESIAAATAQGPEVAEPNSSPDDNNDDGWGSSYAAWKTIPAVPAPVPKPKDTPHSWINWTECYDDYCPDHYGTKNAIGKWPQKPWSRRRRQPAEDY